MSNQELNYLMLKVKDLVKFEIYKEFSLIDYKLHLTSSPTDEEGNVDQDKVEDSRSAAMKIRANLLDLDYQDSRSLASKFSSDLERQGYTVKKASKEEWAKLMEKQNSL